MDYNFLDSSVDIENLNLPESGSINPFLLKNSYAEMTKAVDFLNSEYTFLYIHGFLGTGKRQFINYVSGFLDSEVIKLEYYCKASTVCDDIMLEFIDIIEKNPISKVVSINAKVTTLSVKLQQYVSSIKKPFVVIIHSFDDISESNRPLVIDCLEAVSKSPNVKIIASTRAMMTGAFGGIKVDKKIFLKALSKDIFKEFISSYKITFTDTVLEDFYKYTRGYYYYTALALKIVQAMKISLSDFLNKFTRSGMNFDSYLGLTYINLIPATIRNFFWFLRTIRHGISINALAVFELYDDFSLEYLKNNLMIFQVGEMVYVQDYFQQNIDISIPAKTEIKLHKYIISIYEKQLKEPLQTREIMISRQALRAEIEYHNRRIEEIESGKQLQAEIVETVTPQQQIPVENVEKSPSIDEKLKRARKLAEEKKNTDAIDVYMEILNSPDVDLHTLIQVRMLLARLYKDIGDYQKAQYYYELVEIFYKKHNEVINLNYLYYELTDLYFLMYKNDRAVETIKKVIYSVDTPQSLMVSACTLLGNIYSSMDNPDEAYSYYQKALASLEENTDEETLAELYFKYALANDDRKDEKNAFEYYAKCITIGGNNPYRALAYSNMGSCYFDNENYSDARDCFQKAYDLEKSKNNYDGIFYTASYLAKICEKEKDKKALDYLLEAKQSAEFINEDFYLLEATIALGDYYYNNISLNKKALIEYFKARRLAQALGSSVDISKIESRIKDMKFRMSKEVFEDIEKKYG